MTAIDLLQSFASPPLTAFFRLVSFLGEEQFTLLLLPALYWVWRKQEVRRMSFLFLAAMFLTLLLKDLFHVARPEGVALVSAEGYSYPSGHAVAAAIVWGYLASAVRRPCFTAAAAAIILSICLSRLYLGVHFPGDVLGGAAIGLLMVWGFRHIEERVSSIVHRLGPGIDLMLLMGVAFALCLLVPVKGTLIIMGLLLGMGSGMILEERWICFRTAGSAWCRAARIVLGSAGTLALWKGLSLILPESHPFVFLRYAITGFWMMGLAPFAFTFLRLSSRECQDPCGA